MGNNVSDNSPFFIIGTPRSGTTLMERLLNRHPRLFIPPETYFFDYLYRESEYGTGSETRNEIMHMIMDYTEHRAFKLLGVSNEVAQRVMSANSHGEAFSGLMNYLSGLGDKPRWGEKTPQHLRYVNEIRSAFPDAKFIVMVRDARAVVLSRLKHPKWNDNLVTASRVWRKDAKRIIELKALEETGVVCMVHFEQLLDDKENEIARVMKFLGESYSEQMLDGKVKATGNFADYYSQSWMQKSAKTVDASRADGWRTELAEREIVVVEKLNCRELKMLGYSLSGVSSLYWPITMLKHRILDLLVLVNRFFKRVRVFRPLN